MKQGTTALVATAVLLAGTTALAAQGLPPPGYYDARAYYGRVATPYVYAPYEDTMSAYEVVPILRARGFRPLSRAVRRGGFYLVQALHPRGDEGRVVIDAYTGQIVRFIPATEMRASRRGDEMVLVYQGPTFPPPDALRSGPPPSTLRGDPRQATPPPSLASRAPSSAPLVTPKPRPQSAPQKPESAQAPPVPAPVETKPAAASPPLVQKPVEKTPAAPGVQPTQPLPPVQTME
jgi:hypothetical protein